ncbi:reverse transcriptase domain-containing protein [Vibrio harveyi]
MRIIADKYRALKPEISYLTDEVVISQAWKKTHAYIRSFNWYADTLALDVSALGIESEANKWGKQLQVGRLLNKLELVPAAKSESWIIDKELGWIPKALKDKEEQNERVSSPPVRPLAHLSIRDQTWATTAMMCLADAVETEQGDCSRGEYRRVYSYGNRLVCDWNSDKQAWFRWGNSEIYRKFFSDYQNFLKRPVKIGQLLAEQEQDADHVYVVNLDLSKFYDNIDRNELVQRLKKISLRFGHPQCDMFWNRFSKIIDWQWRESDLKFAEGHNIPLASGKGLPQGLVSSGFFANAYMSDFDRQMGGMIGYDLPIAGGVVLHDYCRYVDDLRLVISTENENTNGIKTAIQRFVRGLLKDYAGQDIKLNLKKTKITAISDLDNSGSMANRIDILQGELSGPADRDVLDNASGILEGLLSVESEGLPDLTPHHKDLPLVQLATFDHDIRSDTLKRFAANRLEGIMRSKRGITSLDESILSGKQLVNEGELLAKKLILAWMKDPSLSIVLRKAIEIHPVAELFEPVFSSIYSRSNFCDEVPADQVSAIMMDYLLADLFRCCCDFNGFFQKISYPLSIKPTSVMELASFYAQKVLVSKNKKPFIERQALLLLAIMRKPAQYNPNTKSIQTILHLVLNGTPPSFPHDKWVLFEIAGQTTGLNDTYANLLLNEVGSLRNSVDIIEMFAKRGGPFWLAIWDRINRNKKLKAQYKAIKWAEPISASKVKGVTLKLSKIIASYENGFEHEAALIKLGLALLELADKQPEVLTLSPKDIKVEFPECQSWSDIWHPKIKKLVCHVAEFPTICDPRFAIPLWLLSEDDDTNSQTARKIYWIGSILRASAVGGGDFTGNRWKGNNCTTYKGVRTSWYKRRMGMMHSPEALIGEYATVTDWFSELLMRCLQWPGFESNFVRHEDIRNIVDLNTFRLSLRSRLSYLNRLHCKASDMPALPSEVSRPKLASDSGFRIVTVQQLLPRSSDFSEADPLLSRAKIRAAHREHLLSVCQVAYKTLSAKLQAEGTLGRPAADLIIFSELSVHIDDQDIIKRLADKTRSMIFAGLVFTDHNGKLVNIARWFIPDYRESGRQWIIRDQGKFNMTSSEEELGIEGYRPCQHLIEVHREGLSPFKISGAICYDATDISLAADLRDKTDLFIVVAHNQDVNTFDNMAAALHYHMYQHVVISNIGEFGGSTIQAPFKEPYERLITHVHGANQVAINVADIDPYAFTREHKTYKKRKTKPAGFNR